MARSSLRIGLVGAGANTRLRHIPGLRALPDVEIVGVVNRRPESTAAAAREHDIPRTYRHWEELVADPEILVLVEPTSAVDAHTEARIADRVTRLRSGRTTVVCTLSPLWLHHADRVVVLADDRVVADGHHDDLLAHDPTYRAVVARAMDEEVTS